MCSAQVGSEITINWNDISFELDNTEEIKSRDMREQSTASHHIFAQTTVESEI